MNPSILLNGSKFTKNDLTDIYNIFIRNIIRLNDSGCEIKEITPKVKFNHIPMGTGSGNPYLHGQTEVNYINLGKSVVKNGSYWCFFVKGNVIENGNHRMRGLKELVKVGYLSEDTPFMAIDVKNADKKVEFEYPLAKTIKQFNQFGTKTKIKTYKSYWDGKGRFDTISKLFKYLTYEWEKKYEFFPTSRMMNSVNYFHNNKERFRKVLI